MKISREFSEIITLLTSFSMLLVVMMHGILPANTALSNYLTIAIFHTFTRIAVPIFFIVSGFLLYNNVFEPCMLKQKIIKRTQTLFLPYVVWSLFALFFFLIFSTLPYTKDWFRTVEFSSYSIVDYIKCFTTNPINTPLWFIRDLYLLSLCSPLIIWFYTKFPRLYYFALVVIGVMWIADIKVYCFYMESLLFFNLGFLCSRNNNVDNLFCRQSIINKHSKLCLEVLFIQTIINCVLYDESTPIINTLLRKTLIIIGVISIPAIANLLLTNKISKFLNWFKKYSFIIYVTHIIVIQIIRKILLIIVPQTNIVFYAITYIMEVGLTILVGVATYKLLITLSPKLARLLTGGRC